MRYELVPMTEGTEGRIREFGIKHMGLLLDVSRKTYTYEKIDGEFRRLPEQWVGDHQNFGCFADAMTSVLEGMYSVPGLLDGDTFSCDFEGFHYEWILMHLQDRSFYFDIKRTPLEKGETREV